MAYNNLFTVAPNLNLNNSTAGQENSLRDISNWTIGYDKTSDLKLGILSKVNTNQVNLFGNMVNAGRIRGVYEFFSNQFTLGRVSGAVQTITLDDGSVKWDVTVNNSGALVATSGSGSSATTLTLASPDGTKWDITINSSGTLIATSGSSNAALSSITLKSPANAYWVLSINNAGVLTDTVSVSINSVVICTKSVTDYSSGKMEYMVNNTWYPVKWTDGNDLNFLPYHVSFAQYFDSFRMTNTLYFCNGDTFSKFFTDNTLATGTNANNQAVTLSDTSGTPIVLTGTLTFNSDKSVTGSGTSFTSQIQKGRWIAKASASLVWEEVAYVVSDTLLYVRDTAGITGSGSSGDSRLAPLTTLRPLFCLTWKDKLWYLNLFNGPDGSVYSRLGCSDTWSSATPQALETFTKAVGNTADTLDIRMQDVSYGTGFIGAGDYLYVFSENEYIVFQYDTSVSPPISEVRRFRYGCNSNDTLKLFGYSVLYFTGKEPRQTDGMNDVPLGNDIKDHILYNADINIMPDYFGLTATDNKYPCALLDTFNMQYRLWVNDISQTDVRFEYVYDLEKGQWISGPSNFYNIGKAIQTFSLNNTLTTGLASSLILYMEPSSQDYLSSIAFNDSGTQEQGSLMTQDKFYNDVKSLQERDFIDIWVHVPSGLTTTFDFQFWADGKAQYPTRIQRSIVGSVDDQFTLMRFPTKSSCNYFRWQLRDIAYSGSAASGSSVTIIAADEKLNRIEGR